MAEFRNRHGRKGGRGLRPWLLWPKLVAVVAMVGGIAAAAVLMRPGQSLTLHELSNRLEAVSTLFYWLVIPGISAAIALGAALVITGGAGVMLRLRWTQVKLAILLMTIPVLHVVMRHQMVTLRQHVNEAIDARPATHGVTVAATPHPVQMDNLFYSAVAALVVMLLVLWLSRIKPRLGQNRAHLAARRPAKEGAKKNAPA